MDNRTLTGKLKKLARLCNEAFILECEIYEESTRRHGYTPSEVDCDSIIDSCSNTAGGATGMTAKQFDEAMKESIKLNTDCDGVVKTN